MLNLLPIAVFEGESFDLIRTVCERFVPNQIGALAIGFLVAFMIAGDTQRIFSMRNAVVFLLTAISVLFVDVLKWERRFDTDSGLRAGALVFSGIYAYTALFAITGCVLAFRRLESTWKPNIGVPGLAILTVLLVGLNITSAFGRDADDCGYYTNLGAQRWVETGTLPYGDTALRGPDAPGFGAAATYGPMLYAAHVPVQLVLGASNNAADADPMAEDYRRPPMLATQLTSVLFHLAGLVALFLIGRKLRDTSIGLSLVALYAGSAFVFGMGSNDLVINGVAFISHIAPAAVVLCALLAVDRPFIAGILLAVGAGVLFYPAFFFPLWLGWYFWQKRGALQFLGGFALAGALIALLVVLGTHTGDGENSIRLFFQSTLEHQEGIGAKEYGASRFGFWGTHPGLAEFWQNPLFGESSLFKPTFLLFTSLSLVSFFLARGRDVTRLAALTAMLAAAVQLWKTHASGSYIEWYFPLILIALFARGPITPVVPAASEEFTFDDE